MFTIIPKILLLDRKNKAARIKKFGKTPSEVQCIAEKKNTHSLDNNKLSSSFLARCAKRNHRRKKIRQQCGAPRSSTRDLGCATPPRRRGLNAIYSWPPLFLLSLSLLSLLQRAFSPSPSSFFLRHRTNLRYLPPPL